MNSENLTSKVIQALENHEYKWRTVKGISKEIGESEKDVLLVIKQNMDVIVKSSVPSKDGEDLYTTRKHFNKSSSTMDKIIGAFKGRLR